nr:MAG TPA: repressor domain protein [Caudoviricetes sp.]
MCLYSLTFKKVSKMKNVEIFNSPMFGELRTSRNEKDEPLFCLKDVCDSLGLQVGAVVNRLQSCHISSIKVATEVISHGAATGKMQEQEMFFVTEPDLYRVIFQSRKPSARKFQDWVFEEVLPTLRKEGSYSMTQSKQSLASYQIEDPIERAKRWIEEQQHTRALEAQTEQQAQTIGIQQKELTVAAPKVKYYDDTLSSTDCLTTTQVADDLGISARALNQQLSNAGIQYFQSGSWHLKGKFREWQLASTRTYNYIKGDGSTGTKVNLVWNQRGKRFILALYNNDFNVKDAIAEINGEKRAALVSKNNQSNF